MPQRTNPRLTLISLILIFSIAFSGCALPDGKDDSPSGDSNKAGIEKGQVLICDFSASIPSVKYECEYEFADYEKYKDIKVKPKTEITINGITLKGEYRRFEYLGFNYYPVYEYKTSSKVTFMIDEKGSLTDCFFGDTPANDKTEELTQAQCFQIAKDIISEYVDPEQYEASAEEYPHYDGILYKFRFRKVINSIETTDCAEVAFQTNGNLYYYTSFMLGRIDEKLFAKEVDWQSVTASVYQKLDQMYADVTDTYSYVEYGEPVWRYTVLKDGSPGLLCSIEANFVVLSNGRRSEITDLIQFVIGL